MKSTKTCVRCQGFAIFDELVDIVNSGNEWGACYRCVNCGHCEFLMPPEPYLGKQAARTGVYGYGRQ